MIRLGQSSIPPGMVAASGKRQDVGASQLPADTTYQRHQLLEPYTDLAMSRPIVVIICSGSSSEIVEP